MSEVIKSYKGFDKDLKCRGFQYEIGREYEEKKAVACNSGFHACEVPLDVLGYYPPATSRYCEVEQDGQFSRDGGNSKVASTKIKIGAEIGIPGLVKAHVEYVRSHCTNEHNADPGKPATAGYKGAATAGYKGAATAGYKGAATAGDSGAATAGDYGAATAGNSGAATAGDYGAATAGDSGAATAGYKGAATAGNYGAATSRGSVAVGENGVGTVRGEGVKIKGGMGAILVCAVERDDNYEVKTWAAAVVDGEKIKADTWYTVENGEFVETE